MSRRVASRLQTERWVVSVERNDERVVTIESNCLSGRDLSEEDERVIKLTARHLLAFVGPEREPV